VRFTGEIYNSVNEAAMALKVKANTVSTAVKRKIKAGGHYVERA